MDDKDNLYFSFDDEQEQAEPEKEVKAEEGGNRSFVFIAIVLGGLFLLVICGTVGYFMFGQSLNLFGAPAPTEGISSNELTNQVMSTLISMTQTSAFETQTAPTEVPTDTQAPKPSETPTSDVETTDVGTQVAEVTEGTPGEDTTPGLAGAATTAAPGTGTATLGAGGAASGGTTTTPTVKPTSSIIEVTPLGGSTPTQLVSGIGTGSPTSSIIEVTAGGQGGGAGKTPTGQGGPVTPGAAATIPTTGFAGGAGLAGAGVLAMLLVVVVVVVRKIRLNDK